MPDFDGQLIEEPPRQGYDLWLWQCFHCGRLADWPLRGDAGTRQGLRQHLRCRHGIDKPNLAPDLKRTIEMQEFLPGEPGYDDQC